MKAKVTIGGRESDLFDVLVGVKQERVLAPVIFNLFLVAVTLACRNGLPSNAGIPHTYHLDGSLFNLHRLKDKTKISNDRIYELQYADDAAIPAHSVADLQRSLDTLSTAYKRASLLVYTKKTEVLSSVVTHNLPALSSVHGDTLSNVQEFTCLGNILSDSCSLDSEVEHSIKAASSAFGRLKNMSSSITTLPYPLKWPFTGQSVSQLCCTVVRHGHSIDDTSRPSRHFTSAVCKASLASDGGRKYHTLSSSRKLD